MIKMFRNIIAATVAVVAALVFSAGTAHADVHQRGAASLVMTADADPNVVAYELAGTPIAETYLFSVRANVSAFHATADDHSILALGVSTCQAFGRGVTVVQMANAGLTNGFSPWETGVVMGAATSQLCPEYAPVMRAEFAATGN